MRDLLLKRCAACNRPTPKEEFSVAKNANGRCKSCLQKHRKRQKEKAVYDRFLNRKPRARSKRIYVTKIQHSDQIEKRARTLFSNTKTRARETRRAFNISLCLVRILLMARVCARSGIPFDMQANKQNTIRNPFAPSIDRIDNARGYEVGNVQLVCTVFNMGKNEHSEIDFLAMCVAVAKKHQNNPAVIVRLMELGVS